MRYALPLLVLAAGSGPLAAQTTTDAYVLLAEEIDRPPVPKSRDQAFYPQAATAPLGRVVLQLVVQKDGRVRPGSIRVLSTPDSLFAAAARETALSTTFSPGRHRDKAEPTLLEYTVIVRVATPRCTDGVMRAAASLCADTSSAGRRL